MQTGMSVLPWLALLLSGFEAAATPLGAGIELQVTVGTEPPPACGTASSLDVVIGEQVNYCFTVTNHTDQTLTHHSLNDDQNSLAYPWPGSPFFAYLDIPGTLAPGGTLQHNVVVTAGNDQAPHFVWASTAGEPHYSFESAPAVFEDISATGTPITSPENSFLSPPPFPFVFMGLPNGFFASDAICFRFGGALQLVRDIESCLGDFQAFSSDNGNGPAPDMPPDYGNAIVPFWDLFAGGTSYYEVLGDAPNRRLVVQWDQMSHFTLEGEPGWDCVPPPEADGVTFQAILEEGGSIRFVYEDTEFGGGAACGWEQGASASAGLAGFDRTPQYWASHNQPTLTDGLQISWTQDTSTYTAQGQAQVRVGAARIALEQTQIEVSALPGASASSELRIGNAGDRPLEWTLEHGSAKLHFPPPGKRYAAPARRASGSYVPPSNTAGTPAAAAASPFAQPTSTAQPFGEGAVPAYATKMEAGQAPYGGVVTTLRSVSIDLAAPDSFTWTGWGPVTIYAADFVGDDFSRQYVLGDLPALGEFTFGTLDTATGEQAVIGEALPNTVDGEQWQGLSWDRTTDTLYAASSACTQGPGPSVLYVIDPKTAALTAVGRIDADGDDVCIGGISVGPDGAMYGIDVAADTLLAIDKSSGAASVIGSVGFDLDYNGSAVSNSMDFDDATGTLYLAAYTDFEGIHGGLHTLDLATGVATRIAPFPRLPESQWLALVGFSVARSGGVCVHPDEVPWLSTAVTEGSTTPGEESVVGLNFTAADLEPGLHEANLCVTSNDRTKALVRLPVRFVVGPSDRIFASGFEVPKP